jgi:hypothetical protein
VCRQHRDAPERADRRLAVEQVAREEGHRENDEQVGTRREVDGPTDFQNVGQLSSKPAHFSGRIVIAE